MDIVTRHRISEKNIYILFTLLKVDNIHGGWSLQVNKKILNVNQEIHGKIPLTTAGRVRYQQDYSVYILIAL